MSPSPIRVAVAVGCAAAILAAAVFGGHYLGLAAPASGSLYDTADRDAERIENPYGEASVWYDDYGVPHVEAENERALYFAVGYLQARDRLFQMDLQRRLIGGELSEAFGERAVSTDRFYRSMDFQSAAEASWAEIRETEAGPGVEAYSDGVNHYMTTQPLPPEFGLLEYEPDPWTPVDTLIVGKQIAWSLSGNFADLERATVRERLGEEAARELYPDRLPHDTPVIRDEADYEPFDPAVAAGVAEPSGGADTAESASLGGDPTSLANWVGRYDHQPGIGSNNWVVSGEHTASGKPILANDPHLQLTVPGVWYEMHLKTPNMETRGVSFPGVPFVVIGRTADVAWGVTNVGGDFTDLYRYETRNRSGTEQYRYRGEWRDVATEEETIRVADGEDVTVTVRKTVHGALIRRDGARVGVAWPGFSATNESLGVYQLNHAEDVDDARDALRTWDVPAQNFVVATRDGETLYYPAGRYPLRVADGEVVRGDRIFDGSAGEGEWRGYTPYGTSNWSGFVPFESIPHVEDPDLLATANQRTMDDPPYYVGNGMTYADPYRGERIYDVLERDAESGDGADGGGITAASTKTLQRDVRSLAAAEFVPYARAGRAGANDSGRALVTELDGWDGEMRADSRAALVYALWLEEFRTATFEDEFAAANLSADAYPKHVVLADLPADSRWFDRAGTARTETRADVAALALNRTAARLGRTDYETYGDYNRLRLTHPFDQAFLNYDTRPMNGSAFTVFNFRAQRATQAGSSWRMVVDFGNESNSAGVIPGGQSGLFWSEHYDDQLPLWADGEYKSLTMDRPDGEPDLVFVDGGGDSEARRGGTAGDDPGNGSSRVVAPVGVIVGIRGGVGA
ncbi:penicillin acylase family protein [Halobium salinum]|uniref:Penicillin acylase family protein n=1 Tax=Halobium salinum TaxID=1364940 RepID=A0ABD5P7I7_9EURY|nr:penicillin acylase family protein [Halobium salinum]